MPHVVSHTWKLSCEAKAFCKQSKGEARGSWGARDPPFCKPFFNQPTCNTWRKCHNDIFATVTIWWVTSLSHIVTPTPPPFEKSWLRPCRACLIYWIVLLILQRSPHLWVPYTPVIVKTTSAFGWKQLLSFDAIFTIRSFWNTLACIWNLFFFFVCTSRLSGGNWPCLGSNKK